MQAAFPRQRIQTLPFQSSAEMLLKATTCNPVYITLVDNVAAQISYTNLYGLRELQNASAALSGKIRSNYYGVGMTRFGNNNYNETTVTLLFGFPLHNAGRVGIGIHGYQLAITNYGEAKSWGLDLGTRWKLSDKVSWEIAYTNLNNPTIGAAKDPLPQQISTAIHFQPLAQLNSQFYLQQNIRYLPQYGFGLAYHIFQWMTIAADMNTQPLKSNVGVNLHWHGVQIQYVFSWNASQLPVTHRFGVGFLLE